MRSTGVFLIGVILIFFGSRSFAAEFKIDKIEPPCWWTGMRWRNVQLCITGEGLRDVTAKCSETSIRVAKVHEVEDSHYLFIDLELASDTPSADYTISLQKNGKEISLQFPVKKRRANQSDHQGFDQRDVVYLIVPDRFADGVIQNNQVPGLLPEYDRARPEMRHGGDLRGIVQRLDYLKELGVTALWLTPVLENNGISSYHGYKTTDHYRIDRRFGSNDDYRHFVQSAHEHGMKVIFDHVSNHIGIRHPWLKRRPTFDWINGTISQHESNKHFLLAVSDPHASEESVRMLKEFWFVDRMPDLNQRNPFLANYLIQNTLWWIEFSGIDGIREDTYPYADQAFLSRWAKAIFDEYPRFNIVGEIWANQSAVISRYQDGSPLQGDLKTHLPSVMDFPLMQALRNFVTAKGKLRDVHDVFAQDFLYAKPEQLVVFMENHDSTRGAFLTKEFGRVKLALGVVLTSRGIPQLLYGSELGMKGGPRHVDLRADFPGGFPGDKRNAFSQAGRTQHENDAYDFISKLLRLRKKYPAIAAGKMIHFQPHWNQDVYKYVKVLGEQRILIVANGESHECDVDLAELGEVLQGRTKLRDLLNNEFSDLNRESRLTLAPSQFCVFLLER